MSLNLNQITIAGRLTRDPEVKVLANERTVTNMGVAINRKYKGSDGTMKEEVTFLDVCAWGKTAENCGRFLKKGSAVYVEGRLRSDEWQTQSGDKRRALKVDADTVQFLDPKEESANAPVPEAVAPPKRPAPITKDEFDDEPPF